MATRTGAPLTPMSRQDIGSSIVITEHSIVAQNYKPPAVKVGPAIGPSVFPPRIPGRSTGVRR